MRCVLREIATNSNGRCAKDGDCNLVARVDTSTPTPTELLTKHEARYVPREVFSSYFVKEKVNRIVFGKEGGLRGIFLGDPYCSPSRRALKELLALIKELGGDPELSIELVLVGFPLGGSESSIGNIHYQICVEEITKRGAEYVEHFINNSSVEDLDQRLKNSLEALKLERGSSEEVRQCIESKLYKEQVAADYKAFSELGFNGTPAIIFEMGDMPEEFLPWDAEDFRSYLRERR